MDTPRLPPPERRRFPRPSGDPMRIAQLSDPHVTVRGVLSNGFVDTAAALRRAVTHLLALVPRPDAVLLTGDLVDSVQAAGYARLLELLAPLPMPLYTIPGNHDDRTLLREAFAGRGFLPATGQFLHYAVEDIPLRLIGLDTQRPGETGGELCAERLDWLAARLAEAPRRPTLLFMHHPPFATGLPTDRHGFPGAEALGALLERHPQVRRIVCGHEHRAVQTLWHGVLASTCPATAHQLALDLEGGLEGVLRSRIALEPPALQVHTWSEAHGLVSHTSPIGDFAVREFPRKAH
jgi:3',5'-cyclic AMP phosphodiesterase CpdA